LILIAGSCDNSVFFQNENKEKDINVNNSGRANVKTGLINEFKVDKNKLIVDDTFNNQINLLNDYFFIYDKIDAEGGLVKLPPIKKNLVIGDSSFTIQLIKQYLLKIGDIPVNDNTGIFDSLLLKGIKSIQFRLGMETSGIISKSLVSEMNIPVKSRVKQISINIESNF
jgi:hypothetical protein